jgi:hypothetical protein
MRRLPLHTPESAPAASRSYLERAQAANGFLPNLVASLANAPAALEAYLTVGEIIGRSGLTLAERETVQITAADSVSRAIPPSPSRRRSSKRRLSTRSVSSAPFPTRA